MARAKRRRGHAMVYVTTPDRKSAGVVARAILRDRLAACANLFPSDSLYWWEGRIEAARETVVVFKTRSSCVDPLIRAVRRLHPYEVPCIVSYPMGPALVAYTEWIDRETRAQR